MRQAPGHPARHALEHPARHALDRLVEGPVRQLATLSAILGGLVLCALIAMTCVSIAGRALSFAGLGPVRGDFELIELGMAFVVFAFLPLAQVNDAHASVDLAVGAMPVRPRRALLAVWEIVLAALMALIAWRLLAGFEDRLRYGDTSYLIGIPLAWAYAACLVPAGIAVLVSLALALRRLAGGGPDVHGTGPGEGPGPEEGPGPGDQPGGRAGRGGGARRA